MSNTSSTNSSWLVIIDMQNVFSPCKYTDWVVPKFNSIIEPILKLTTRFPNRTLITRFVSGAESVGAPHAGSWGPYYQTFPFANVPNTDPLYDVVDPLKYLIDANNDNVVTMTTFSKWGNEQNGVCAKTGQYPGLVLTGVATDCCVLSTAISAAEAGAFVTVVTDACAGSSDENQTAAVNIFKGYAPLISLNTYQDILNG